MENCDEAHLIFNSESNGVHFDLGMAFALNKPIKVGFNCSIDGDDEYSNSYLKMIKKMEKIK